MNRWLVCSTLCAFGILAVIFQIYGDSSMAVRATAETDPVPTAGDAADDPAIWVNAKNPMQSVIIGTDKDAGLAIYDLSGMELSFLEVGRINNVDVRYGFSLGGRTVDLVAGGNQTDGSLAVFAIDPETRLLENVAARTIITCPPYGSCLYRSSITGRYYHFVNSRQGHVEQWELFDNGSGKIDARRVRYFRVPSRPEGCVADDELGHFYIGLEAGVWKFGAEPTAGTRHSVVDETGFGVRLWGYRWFAGHLLGRHLWEVEGISLYRGQGGTGFLIVSSQLNNEFVVYRREEDNAYVTSFRIESGDRVDGVSHTDGIDSVSLDLGPAFPGGLFVAQDHLNDGANQNFKLVPGSVITNIIAKRDSR